MSTVHAKTVVTADDGASEVGSDEWNQAHNTTLAGGEIGAFETRFVLASTGRLSIANSARMLLAEVTDGLSLRGSFSPGSVTVLNDNWFLQYKRAGLSGNARVNIVGTGEMFLFDLAPVGRLVLAGRGG